MNTNIPTWANRRILIEDILKYKSDSEAKKEQYKGKKELVAADREVREIQLKINPLSLLIVPGPWEGLKIWEGEA